MTQTAAEQPALRKNLLFIPPEMPQQQNHNLATLKQRQWRHHPREHGGELSCHSYHSFPHQAMSGSSNPFEIPVSLSFTLLPAQQAPMLALTGACHF